MLHSGTHAGGSRDAGALANLISTFSPAGREMRERMMEYKCGLQ